MLSLTDGDGSVTTYSYDTRNLRVQETYPGHSLPGNNEIVTFAFDAAGRMTRRTDQNSDNTLYVYDRVNRLIQRTYPDTLNDTFAYDNASRLTDATSNRYSNLVHRAYDAGGRMTSEALTIGSQTFTTSSAYDAANRRTSITYPNGKVVAQTFTNRDQLSNVKYDAVNVATLTYDLGMRKATNTFGNSKVETRTYRGDNRTNTIAIPTGITNFTYAWDANKNKTEENDAALPTNVQDYSYDNEDRLTGFARNSGQTQAWTLSLVGDWTAFNDNGSAQTRTHNTVHELTAVNSTSLAYDLKGNLATNSNAQTYTWDFENCMKTAVVGADTATYQYDAFRRRVKKSFQGNSTIFAYDGWRSIAEYDNGASTSSANRVFVFGTYLDEPLMLLVGSTKYYYHANDLYSVAVLTNASGTVVERYKYDPYGKVSVVDASGTAKSDPNNSEYGNPFTFQGQRVDKETRLGQWRYRYYDFGLGRFLNRTPWGYIQKRYNLYDTLKNNPRRFVEPYSGVLTLEVMEDVVPPWVEAAVRTTSDTVVETVRTSTRSTPKASSPTSADPAFSTADPSANEGIKEGDRTKQGQAGEKQEGLEEYGKSAKKKRPNIMDPDDPWYGSKTKPKQNRVKSDKTDSRAQHENRERYCGKPEEGEEMEEGETDPPPPPTPPPPKVKGGGTGVVVIGPGANPPPKSPPPTQPPPYKGDWWNPLDWISSPAE